MTNLRDLAANLEQGPDGIWVARSRERAEQDPPGRQDGAGEALKSEISYPEDGNLNCLALEADSFWFEHRNHCIQALMRNYPPPGMVFDVGGGNGYVAQGLQRAGFTVALVEPGWQGVQNARLRGVETLVCSTLEDAGFQPDAVPAVGLFDVLEHIEDDRAFLSTVRKLLSPGGRIYLTVPAFQALWSADDDYAGHHRRYSLGSLRRVLEQAGLRVDFASYLFFMLPLPIFLLRALPTRLGLRKQEAWETYQQEHQSRSGMVGQVLGRLLDWELTRLRNNKTIPVGGSCLVAARRVV
jgi:SAM-dependent methyltransferase